MPGEEPFSVDQTRLRIFYRYFCLSVMKSMSHTTIIQKIKKCLVLSVNRLVIRMIPRGESRKITSIAYVYILYKWCEEMCMYSMTREARSETTNHLDCYSHVSISEMNFDINVNKLWLESPNPGVGYPIAPYQAHQTKPQSTLGSPLSTTLL